MRHGGGVNAGLVTGAPCGSAMRVPHSQGMHCVVRIARFVQPSNSPTLDWHQQMSFPDTHVHFLWGTGGKAQPDAPQVDLIGYGRPLYAMLLRR